jgi:hypothetical protein
VYVAASAFVIWAAADSCRTPFAAAIVSLTDSPPLFELEHRVGVASFADGRRQREVGAERGRAPPRSPSSAEHRHRGTSALAGLARNDRHAVRALRLEAVHREQVEIVTVVEVAHLARRQPQLLHEEQVERDPVTGELNLPRPNEIQA